MDSFQAEEYDSETFDYSEEETEPESADDLLHFCVKISEELKFRLKKNSGNEDYCDDIYEDKFTAHKSGSYSYYADILAVAQLNDKRDDKSTTRLSVSPERNAKATAIFPCHWKCSGKRNPSIGAGPLEELFQVLEHQHEFSLSQNTNIGPVTAPLFYPQEWPLNTGVPMTYDEEFARISSIDSDYSNYIDVFNRWNNDSFTSLPSTSSNDFISHGYQTF